MVERRTRTVKKCERASRVARTPQSFVTLLGRKSHLSSGSGIPIKNTKRSYDTNNLAKEKAINHKRCTSMLKKKKKKKLGCNTHHDGVRQAAFPQLRERPATRTGRRCCSDLGGAPPSPRSRRQKASHRKEHAKLQPHKRTVSSAHRRRRHPTRRS